MSDTSTKYARELDRCGLTKLQEECGELIQIAAKKSAFFDLEVHPDGSVMKAKLIEEMGDVMAAIIHVCTYLDINYIAVENRMEHKLKLFESWKEKDSAV